MVKYSILRYYFLARSPTPLYDTLKPLGKNNEGWIQQQAADQANQFYGTVPTVRIKKRICNNQVAFVHVSMHAHCSCF